MLAEILKSKFLVIKLSLVTKNAGPCWPWLWSWSPYFQLCWHHC